MPVHKTSLIFFLLCISALLFSQENVDFVKDNFDEDPAGLRRAMQQIRRGDSYYSGKEYFIARQMYEKAYEFNPNNADLNFKLGICYLHTHPKSKALDFLLQAYQVNPRVAKDILYHIALAYQYAYEFQKSIETYQSFLQSLPEKQQAMWKKYLDEKIQENETGLRLLSRPLNVEIVNLGEAVNSSFPEKRPYLFNENMMLFTTKRDRIQIKETKVQVRHSSENVHVVTYSDASWRFSRFLSNQLSSGYNDAFAGFTPDGVHGVFYSDKTNRGDLYTRRFYASDGLWGDAEYFPPAINSPFKESAATFTVTGDTLFFVSNRRDLSVGGNDIFMSIKDEQGTWGEPQNLGPTINTPKDEENAWFDYTQNVLYFSSNGHETMGGLDIFYSILNTQTGEWSKPVNMGYPVNSPEDDYFFASPGNTQTAFISSARDDSHGFSDIYMVLFYQSYITDEPFLLTEEIDPDVSIDTTGTDVDIFLFDVEEQHDDRDLALDIDVDLQEEQVDVFSGRATDIKPFEVFVSLKSPEETEETEKKHTETYRNFTVLQQPEIILPATKRYTIAVEIIEPEEEVEEEMTDQKEVAEPDDAKDTDIPETTE